MISCLTFPVTSYFELTVGTWTPVWSTPCSCTLVSTPVPLGCLRAASPSPHWVCWLKPEFQPLASTHEHTCLCGSAARQQGPSVLYGSAFHRWVAALSPEPSKLPIYPSWSPASEEGSKGERTFLCYSSHQGHRSCLNSFFSSFILPGYLVVCSLPFWLYEIFRPALSRYSMRTVAHMYVFLMYLWEGEWALCAVPPSWSPPASIL